MNPEFRRLTAIDFRVQRLLALGIVLVGMFGAGYLADGQGFGAATGFAAIAAFFALVFVWGTRQAAESVTHEINAMTWDPQRMSSMSAWGLTWSKLAGATAFSWLGALACLTVYTLSHAEGWGLRQTLMRVVLYAMSGFFAQAACFAISLTAIQRRREFGRVQVVAYQFLGLLAALPPLYIGLSATGGESLLDLIIWYGHYVTLAEFMLVLVSAFALWSLVGAWALMRAELLEPVGPWAWAGFTLFFMAVFAGVRSIPIGVSLQLAVIEIPPATSVALGAGLFCAYGIIFSEPKDRLRLRNLGRALQLGRWRTVATLVPRSLVAVLLAVVGAAAAYAAGGVTFQQLPSLLTVQAALVLFALRDFAFIYWVCLGRSDGGGEGLAAAVLAVAYVPVPMALGLSDAGDLNMLLALFGPSAGAPLWLQILAPAAQTAVIGSLLVGRLRKRRIEHENGALPAGNAP